MGINLTYRYTKFENLLPTDVGVQQWYNIALVCFIVTKVENGYSLLHMGNLTLLNDEKAVEKAVCKIAEGLQKR